MKNFNGKLVYKIIAGVVVLSFVISGTVLAYKNITRSKQNGGLPNTSDSGKNNSVDIGESNQKDNPKNGDTLKPEPEPSKMAQPKNVKAKGLYLTGWTVGSDKNVEHFVNLANTTEINAYVVDIKDDDGYIGYKSSVPEAVKYNAWQQKYDVDKVLESFHKNNIYVIGRIVCFKDPVYSSKRQELAIKNRGGGLWRDNHNLTWLNPYNKDCWPYLIEIAKEGIQKGFDEIQFDYIRFANDGRKSDMNFGSPAIKKYEVINEFLAYAKKELPDAILSADVFGIICESPDDIEDIGQNLESVGKDIDFISPMVYPSHYAVGQVVNGVKFIKPDLDPYGVVYNSLVKAKQRISKVEGYKSKVRPYLQDFTASWLGKGYYQTYGAQQLRQQIKAVYDAGYEEWLIWDASNTYSEDAFVRNP